MRHAHVPIFAMIACLVAYSANIAAPVTDTFHEGELVGFLWHMRAYYQGSTAFPLLVHGGMDYVPSLLAAYFFGDSSVIIGTRFIIATIAALAFFLYLHISYTVVEKKDNPQLWLLACIALFYYFSPPLGSDILRVGSHPLRDVFLFLTVWLFLKGFIVRAKYFTILYLALASLSATVSIVWCYNRGVMAFAFILICVVMLLLRKEYKNFLIVTVFFAIGLFLVEKSVIFGSLSENLANIKYWVINARHINPYPFDIPYLPGYFSLLMLSLFSSAVALFFVCWTIKRHNCDDGFCVVALGLLAVQLLLIKTAYDRAEIEQSFLGGWPSIVVLLYLVSRIYKLDGLGCSPQITRKVPCDWEERFVPAAFGTVMVTFFMFVVLGAPATLSYPMTMKKIITKKTDLELVSPEMLGVKAVLADDDVDCYFNWVNNGVIALLSGKKYCTDYSYVHYASSKHEAKMLEQLDTAAPNVIIYDTKYSGVIVNGVHMSKRFDKVDEYIRSNYDKEIIIDGFRMLIK